MAEEDVFEGVFPEDVFPEDVFPDVELDVQGPPGETPRHAQLKYDGVVVRPSSAVGVIELIRKYHNKQGRKEAYPNVTLENLAEYARKKKYLPGENDRDAAAKRERELAAGLKVWIKYRECHPEEYPNDGESAYINVRKLPPPANDPRKMAVYSVKYRDRRIPEEFVPAPDVIPEPEEGEMRTPEERKKRWKQQHRDVVARSRESVADDIKRMDDILEISRNAVRDGGMSAQEAQSKRTILGFVVRVLQLLNDDAVDNGRQALEEAVAAIRAENDRPARQGRQRRPDRDERTTPATPIPESAERPSRRDQPRRRAPRVPPALPQLTEEEQAALAAALEAVNEQEEGEDDPTAGLPFFEHAGGDPGFVDNFLDEIDILAQAFD